MPTPYTGGCLCGNIRFQATGTATLPHVCSCTICQRHSGAPVLNWITFPLQAIEWTEKIPIAHYRSSAGSSRIFCPHCGSTLGAMDDDGTVALVTGCFDRQNDPALSPLFHSFEDKKPVWLKIDLADRA